MKNHAAALDWATLRGYIEAKRALEVAASGNHSILLVGSAGSGKRMLIRSLMTILPTTPFVEPDPTLPLSVIIPHTISEKGILFLESIEQWDDASLALLRETMLAHTGQFLLTATTAYCSCGNYMDTRRECECSLVDVEAYQKRLRETVQVCFAIEQQIQSFNSEQQLLDESLDVRKRVKATQELQLQLNGGRLVGELSLSEMQADDTLHLDEAAQPLLKQIVAQLPLSPRQFMYLHQVARTVAAMSIANPLWRKPGTHVESNHLAEVIGYRHASYWDEQVL